MYWGVPAPRGASSTNSVVREIQIELPSCRALLLLGGAVRDFESTEEWFPQAVNQVVIRNPRAKIRRYLVAPLCSAEADLDASIIVSRSMTELEGTLVHHLAELTL